MFIAVIRRDLEKSIFLADAEPKSTADASVESPRGQDRYLSPPDPVAIQTYLNAQGLVAVASVLIAATVPTYTGGAVGIYDISSAKITGVAGLGGATAGQVAALQELLAHHFVETDVVKKSFLNGNIHGYLSPTFNPDIHRGGLGQGTQTPFTSGQAIVALKDDGHTFFSVNSPWLTKAAVNTPGAGALRITGNPQTGVGNVQIVSTHNVALTGAQTIDGVATGVNRILLTGQTNPVQNGIWIAAAGAWARPVGAGDMITGSNADNILIGVDAGGTNFGGTFWHSTTLAPNAVVGTNALSFAIGGCDFTGYGLYETSVILLGQGAKTITQEQILAGGGTIAATQIDIPAPVVLGPTTSNTFGAIAATLTQVRVQVNDLLSRSMPCV
jgi:hypothetical protein